MNVSPFSPACIFSFLITAVRRGELKGALEWSDDPELDKKEGTSSSSEVTGQAKSEGKDASAVKASAVLSNGQLDQRPIAVFDDPSIGEEGAGPTLRRSTRKARKP